jgi:hypothetical protein
MGDCHHPRLAVIRYNVIVTAELTRTGNDDSVQPRRTCKEEKHDAAVGR